MIRYCPCCGNAALSKHSNFCSKCGQQLREIPPEDVDLIAPEEDRHKPMPVREKITIIKPEIIIGFLE